MKTSFEGFAISAMPVAEREHRWYILESRMIKVASPKLQEQIFSHLPVYFIYSKECI